MHTVPISIPVLKRIDLRQTKEIGINMRWRTDTEAQSYLGRVAAEFERRGIKGVRLHAYHDVWRGAVLVGEIIYEVKVSSGGNGGEVRKIQEKIVPLQQWWEKNCQVEPVLDERGLTFFTDDDLVLYRLTHL